MLHEIKNDTDAAKDKEPALKVGTATGTVAGILSILLVVAPDALSEKQINVILVIGSFLIPLITAFFTRKKVWSPASVIEAVDAAIEVTKKNIIPVRKPLEDDSDKPPFNE